MENSRKTVDITNKEPRGIGNPFIINLVILGQIQDLKKRLSE
jgi:hypothetical protein